jgi:hypothetical protein
MEYFARFEAATVVGEACKTFVTRQAKGKGEDQGKGGGGGGGGGGEAKCGAEGGLEAGAGAGGRANGHGGRAFTTTVSHVLVTLRSGQFHVVRRLLAAVGLSCLHLHRVAVGSVWNSAAWPGWPRGFEGVAGGGGGEASSEVEGGSGAPKCNPLAALMQQQRRGPCRQECSVDVRLEAGADRELSRAEVQVLFEDCGGAESILQRRVEGHGRLGV